MSNDFELMCDKLSGCSRCCCSNEIVCATNAVKEYVGSDRNRLLKLKAQASVDVRSHYSLYIAIAAMALSVMGILSSVMLTPFLSDMASLFDFSTVSGTIVSLMALLFVSICLCYAIYCLNNVSKSKPVLSWQKYILISIEELEKTNFNEQ